MLSLQVLHDRALPIQARKNLFSWGPNMDLLAVISKEGHLWIYRANGQRVWSFPLGTTEKAVKLRWSPDGKLIFIASKKLGFRLFDIHLGKLVADGKKISSHNMLYRHQSLNDLDVQTINWALETGTGQTSPADSFIKEFENLDLLQPKIATVSGTKNIVGSHGANRFKNLFQVDLTKSLPKLSPLPNVTVDQILSSKLAVDCLNQSKSAITDVLIIGYENQFIDITLNGLFNVKPVQYSEPHDGQLNFLQIGSASNLMNHFIIAQHSHDDGQHNYSVLPINLQFIKQNEDYLAEVVSTSTKILLVLLYLKEVMKILSNDLKAFFDFDTRIISILNEDAAKDQSHFTGPSNKDITKNYYAKAQLYELLLTGMMSDELKSWLENSLGEKNLKKWLKLGNNCIDQSKYKIFSLLVPAAERLVILFNKLKSVAEWRLLSLPKEIDEKLKLAHLFNVNVQTIEICLKFAKDILRTAYKFVTDLNDEQKLFNCFVNWLSSVLADLKDEDDKNDLDGENSYYSITEISEYITKRLNNFEVFHYIGFGSTDNSGLESLVAELSQNSFSLFEQIKESFSGQVIIQKWLDFGPTRSREQEVEIKARVDHNNNALKIITLDRGETNYKMSVYKISTIEKGKLNGGGSNLYAETYDFKPLLESKNVYIKQVEFVNDSEILILAVEQAGTEAVDLKGAKVKFFFFSVIIDQKLDGAQQNNSCVISENSDVIQEIHYFNYTMTQQTQTKPNVTYDSMSIVPELVSVKESNGRRTYSILAQDLHRYTLFTYAT